MNPLKVWQITKHVTTVINQNYIFEKKNNKYGLNPENACISILNLCLPIRHLKAYKYRSEYKTPPFYCYFVWAWIVRLSHLGKKNDDFREERTEKNIWNSGSGNSRTLQQIAQ